MEYWQRYDGKRFDTEEEAYEDYLNNEDTEYLEDILLYFDEGFSASNLLHWAMKQPAFWEAFEDDIERARQEAFENQYCCWEEPDLDEAQEISGWPDYYWETHNPTK